VCSFQTNDDEETMTRALLDDVLHHLHPRLGERAVLRGSLLTALWVEERGVNDLDLLLDGEWTPATVTPVLQEHLASFGAAVTFEVIWAETDFPGVRATLVRGDEELQVDFGWGEQLAVAPRATVVRGLTWRAVAPEVMFGWKVHSLVEHGPRGRWHAKTMADLYLYLKRVPLDPALAKQAVLASFASQHMPLTALDGFFDDPTWGRSRGSRNKFKSYRKRSPWVTFTLDEALPVVRDAVRALLR
jgi:hypothetical protein